MPEKANLSYAQLYQETLQHLEDPEFQRQHPDSVAHTRKAIAEYHAAMTPLLERLRALGCEGETDQIMFEKLPSLSREITDTLFEALEELHDWPIYQAGIVWELTRASERVDGRPLVQLLERTSNEYLQDTICQVIVKAKPHSIDDWIASMEQGRWGDDLRRAGLKKFSRKTPKPKTS